MLCTVVIDIMIVMKTKQNIDVFIFQYYVYLLSLGHSAMLKL